MLETVCGNEAPLTIRRGRVHEHLGFKLDCTVPGEVACTMCDFLQKMSNEFPDDGTFECSAPATSTLLFAIDPDSPKLEEDLAKLFCTLTAKGLFASKRCRPDIQVPVAFLTTRVRSPAQQDWRKLKRVIGHLRATIGIPLILKIDDSGRILIYIDGSFAVHQDMRGHTGMATTLGKGAILSSSSKQKLNTRSSTESEVVCILCFVCVDSTAGTSTILQPYSY